MLALLLGEKAPYVDFGLVRSFLLLLHLLHQETRLTALMERPPRRLDDAPAVEATSPSSGAKCVALPVFVGRARGVVRRIYSTRRASYPHWPFARQPGDGCGLDGARARWGLRASQQQRALCVLREMILCCV